MCDMKTGWELWEEERSLSHGWEKPRLKKAGKYFKGYSVEDPELEAADSS